MVAKKVKKQKTFMSTGTDLFDNNTNAFLSKALIDFETKKKGTNFEECKFTFEIINFKVETDYKGQTKFYELIIYDAVDYF